MEKTIYEKAIAKFGFDKQVDMILEEMAELAQALLKYRRKEDSKTLDNLHEEFVDVQIMMCQLETLLNQVELENWRTVKLIKLESLINKS